MPQCRRIAAMHLPWFNQATGRAALFVAALLCPQLAAASAPPESLTIEQAAAEAVENNLALMAERANIAIANARVLAARLRPNPVVSVAGDHLDLLGTGFNEENAAGPPEYSVRTDFLLERAGKRRYRIEEAEAARSVAELQFLDAVRGKILEVQNACVDAYLANASLELARQSLDSLNQVVGLNVVRVRAGDIAEVELVRSRLAAAQFEATVRQAELRLRAALTRLQVLLSRPVVSRPPAITGELRRDKSVPGLEELQRQARELRPDLRALYRGLERSQADLRLQIAQGKVDYTVGSEYRRQQGIAGKGNSLGFFFNVPLPLFNRNQGEIERARQEERQLQLRIRALESSLAGEVEGAYQQLLAARDLLDSIEGKMVGQARMVRETTEYSYRRGEASLLELLDAQRAFNDTMQSHNEARAEYARSLYLLDSVSGKAAAP